MNRRPDAATKDDLGKGAIDGWMDGITKQASFFFSFFLFAVGAWDDLCTRRDG